MHDVEALLKRWQSAGVVDAATAARIRAHELRPSTRESHALGWQVLTALILGAILLACGVALFVSAHWGELSPAGRFALVLFVVAVFHIGGGLARAGFPRLSTALHAVGTLAAGPAIALVGQIFNIEAHWPAAVLVWALAALAGWVLLRDQFQQTIALLLVPAWILCELAVRFEDHIGEFVYLGRGLFTWAILYLTFFAGSRRKVVAGILFAAAALATLGGVIAMLASWMSWSSDQSFIPFSARVWAWIAIAALPLFIAALHGHKGLIPVAAAVAFALALPWCYSSRIDRYRFGAADSTGTAPNLLAHALVAGFAVFLCAWGVKLVSHALVNFGIAAFAAAVAWFYFSDVFSALGRSLGLIGLGVLFLAGGWALEKLRRRILARLRPAARLAQAIAEVQ